MRKRSYIPGCLPVIEIGENRKNIIRQAADICDMSIAEFERRFHDSYLDKFLQDQKLVVKQGEVFMV